jgi:hypothetical protein
MGIRYLFEEMLAIRLAFHLHPEVSVFQGDETRSSGPAQGQPLFVLIWNRLSGAFGFSG